MTDEEKQKLEAENKKQEETKVENTSEPATEILRLNSTDATSDSNVYWNDTEPTESVFSVGTSGGTNVSAGTYIAYLFASLDGVSKVGSVTVDGSGNTNVDCGFSNGARFILMKRSSGTGSWLVWDTERGIVASGNDPYLLLNTTDAEEGSYDFLEPYSQGFTIVENNFLAGTYIFYAIA